MDAMRLSLITPGEDAERLAVDQIPLLGEIGSADCVTLLISNIGFRGSLTGSNPEPKDLPVYAALLRLAPPALDAFFDRLLWKTIRLFIRCWLRSLQFGPS
jgi:hypothetical protein